MLSVAHTTLIKGPWPGTERYRSASRALWQHHALYQALQEFKEWWVLNPEVWEETKDNELVVLTIAAAPTAFHVGAMTLAVQLGQKGSNSDNVDRKRGRRSGRRKS